MTEDQLNDLAIKIANSIFEKLIAKQQEWDEQFNEQMTEASWGQMEYKKEDALKSNQKKIEELRKLRDKAVEEQDYLTAGRINSEIIDLKNFK